MFLLFWFISKTDQDKPVISETTTVEVVNEEMATTHSEYIPPPYLSVHLIFVV